MIEAWIDGAYSSKDDRGGWASVIIYPDYEVELSGAEVSTTSQRMEMMSLIHTMMHVPKDTPLTVVTDSAYVMNGCVDRWFDGWRKNGWKNSKGEPVKNQTLWAMIAGHLHNREIYFTKVKGHSNIALNERADRLAVGARKVVGYGGYVFTVVGKMDR